MAKSKSERALAAKSKRRVKDLETIAGMEFDDLPEVKKPKEFFFDKNDVQAFDEVVAMGNTIAEKKSDGNRVHIHIEKAFCLERHVKKLIKVSIHLFSSNGNEWDVLSFPELIEGLKMLPEGYYQGEILGIARKGAKNFTKREELTAISKRRGVNPNDVTPELIEKYPLKIDIFDVLCCEGIAMYKKPLSKRIEILNKLPYSERVQPIERWYVKTGQELQDVYSRAVAKGYEGLVVKDPDSYYVPGSRDNDWIKMKEYTTFDVAVLGYYETDESKAAGRPFSALLCGTYNNETGKFETVVKLTASAAKDQDEIFKRIKDQAIRCNGYDEVVKAAGDSIAISPAMKKIGRKIPNVILKLNRDSVLILEVKAQKVTYNAGTWHSCGLQIDGKQAHSFAIAIFEQIRDDKTRASDVTSTQDLHDYAEGV